MRHSYRPWLMGNCLSNPFARCLVAFKTAEPPKKPKATVRRTNVAQSVHLAVLLIVKVYMNAVKSSVHYLTRITGMLGLLTVSDALGP